MVIARAERVHVVLGGTFEEKVAQLRESVANSLTIAQQQVARSHVIISDSHQIIARAKQTLLSSMRIQLGADWEKSRNPIIPQPRFPTARKCPRAASALR